MTQTIYISKVIDNLQNFTGSIQVDVSIQVLPQDSIALIDSAGSFLYATDGNKLTVRN